MFALPLTLFYKYGMVMQDDVETPFCFIPQNPSMILFHTIYSISVTCIQYVIPLAIISYSYLRICYKLWLSVTPGHQSDSTVSQDQQNLVKKRRAVIMLLLVVIIFSLCWFPYQVYFILNIVWPRINNFKYINLIFLISHWLAMSNSCCNPFIYCLCSPQFRY